VSLKSEHTLRVAPQPERLVDETSEEPFDRVAFARHALDLLCPARTTVVICVGSTGSSRSRVEFGPIWGRRPASRWAMLTVAPRASRRAIALAVADLGGVPHTYGLDVLMAESTGLALAALGSDGEAA
jgi:hypothetical protein